MEIGGLGVSLLELEDGLDARVDIDTCMCAEKSWEAHLKTLNTTIHHASLDCSAQSHSLPQVHTSGLMLHQVRVTLPIICIP
jgi:hypothetical protein